MKEHHFILFFLSIFLTTTHLSEAAPLRANRNRQTRKEQKKRKRDRKSVLTYLWPLEKLLTEAAAMTAAAAAAFISQASSPSFFMGP